MLIIENFIKFNSLPLKTFYCYHKEEKTFDPPKITI